MLPNRYIQVFIKTETRSFTIDALAMEFDIRKFMSGNPNEGELSIWNLAPSTANEIKASGKEVVITAGYDGNAGVVFSGDIRGTQQSRTHSGVLGAIKSDVLNVRKGVNYLTKIKVGGAYIKLTESWFSRSYAGTVDISTVVQDAADSLGLATEGIQEMDAHTLSNFSFSGRTSDLLDRVLEDPYPFSWFEDDGLLHINKINISGSRFFVQLSEDTGLLSAPEVTDSGLRLVSMMNPAMRLGRIVRLVSIQLPQADGDWKISSLTLKGNNWDDEHVIELEVTPYEEE